MACLENNSLMNYSYIFKLFIVIVPIFIIFTKMPINIILTSKVVNKDIKIDLNLRYMFNIININIPIYPRKTKSKKKETEQTKRRKRVVKKLQSKKIYKKDLLNILNELKKIHIEEFYSDIYIANTNIAITNFTYLFVNLVYGNLINIIDSNKLYMNIKPNFIENKIYIDFKIHLKLYIKNIVNIFKAMFIAYKNSKNIKKDGKKYESNRIYTKYNGNNT